MTPDLGQYATEVIASYAVTLLLTLGLIGWSLLRARRVKRRLAEMEGKR
ncbi:MAG: heme exporter protein CcmD [Shimia sp.]